MIQFRYALQFRAVATISLALIATTVHGGMVDEAFRNAKIVDELIPTPPFELLDVEFEIGKVNISGELTPKDVRNRPKVSWSRAKDDEFYSLIMTDVGRYHVEWLHWHVSNIPGDNVEQGQTLTSFFPSAPPKGTGEHRYALLMYKQQGKIDFNGHVLIPTFQMNGRDSFSTRVFADKNQLGAPVAGNFYVASWDESVDELNALIEKYNKRQACSLIENLNLIVQHPRANDFAYEFDLFKIQSDDLNFERFEELFDDESETGWPAMPRFDDEWRRNETRNLHTNQAAVFVLVTDFISFLESPKQTLKFYVSYEIRGESSRAQMTSDAGELDVTASTLYEQMGVFENKSEIYRDLLAITSISERVDMTLEFERVPKTQLHDFLRTKLGFVMLRNDNDEQNATLNFTLQRHDDLEKMETDGGSNASELFLYGQSNGCFKNALIRMRPVDPSKIKLKVYVRVNHQIVIITKAIYARYSEKCRISLE